jgi:3-oxoisoapionate decarboxylase
VKLGLSSWACAWNIGVPGHEPAHPLDAGGLIRLAASHGLRLVQIADNLPLQSYTAEELAQVHTVAQDEGVELELGTRGIRPDHIRRYLEVCRLFKCSILRVVVDTATEQPSEPEIVDTISLLAPEIGAAGVTLAIENHDRFEAAVFARMIDHIGSDHVGICLDTVNSFGALEGPAVVIDTLAPYVVNLHLKDFIVRRHPSMMGFEITGAPAGQGRLDIPALLTAMRARARNPNAILEHWPTPEANIDETTAKERAWVGASIEYLRTLIA